MKAPTTTRRDSPVGRYAVGATRSSHSSHGWQRRSTGVAWPSPPSIQRPLEGDELARLLIGRAEALGRARASPRGDRGGRACARPHRHAGEPTDTLGFALLALGRARSNLGQVSIARTLIERALVAFATTGDRVGTARAYHRLAEAQRFDDFAGELQSYRRAYTLYGRDRSERELVAVDLAYLLTVAGGREARDWLARATRLVAPQRRRTGRRLLASRGGLHGLVSGRSGRSTRGGARGPPFGSGDRRSLGRGRQPAHRGPGSHLRRSRRPKPSPGSPTSCGSPTAVGTRHLRALGPGGGSPVSDSGPADRVRRCGGWRRPGAS